MTSRHGEVSQPQSSSYKTVEMNYAPPPNKITEERKPIRTTCFKSVYSFTLGHIHSHLCWGKSGFWSDTNYRQEQPISYLIYKERWSSALVFSPIKCRDTTLRRWRQEDHKFENSLLCKVRHYLENKAYRVRNED